jgi:hypothetical protein
VFEVGPAAAARGLGDPSGETIGHEVGELFDADEPCFGDLVVIEVRPCARPGWFWLDADALTAYAYTLTTGSEWRMLLLAAALVGGDPSTRRRWDALRRAAA